MKPIYMTYRKYGNSWEECVPSRTLAEARGFARMAKSDDAAGTYKVKKIMVSEGEYDILCSEYGLEA